MNQLRDANRKFLMSETLKNFFTMCSGAEKLILGDARCAIERNKYASIGATVLVTAVLASLSGGYAVYTTFRNVPLSICLGILWGLVIFNLDRYIVSSLRRPRISLNLTRKERLIAWARFIAKALPRLLLAVFISIVITRPLELKLFEREINADLEGEKSRMSVEIERQKRLELPRMEELGDQNKKLRQEILDKEKLRDELHELAMEEALGKSGQRTTGILGKGIVYEQRWQAYLRAETDLKELRRQNEEKIAAHEQQITALQTERDAELKDALSKIEGMDGLLARLRAHRSLTEKDGSIALASWFLIILFILLETAPIVVKLLSERGPYEDIYETKEHEVYVNQRRIISNINDEANTRITLSRRRNAALLAAESRLRDGLMASLETLVADELRKARKEIARTIVAHFKGAELKEWETRFGAALRTETGNGFAPAPAPEDQAIPSAIPSQTAQAEDIERPPESSVT